MRFRGTDEELMAIINAWVDPGVSHVPGCSLTFDGYCLDCHSDAFAALQEIKRRRGIGDGSPVLIGSGAGG